MTQRRGQVAATELLIGRAHEKAFNDTYSELLRTLQQAWTVGGNQGQSLLGQAVGDMFSLGPLAVEMMQIPLATGNGNYGPGFRVVGP